MIPLRLLLIIYCIHFATFYSIYVNSTAFFIDFLKIILQPSNNNTQLYLFSILSLIMFLQRYFEPINYKIDVLI
jgi:hypothetical protein